MIGEGDSGKESVIVIIWWIILLFLQSKPAVDQEGYSIRPQDADKITWSDEEKEDSDSDSDWEDGESHPPTHSLTLSLTFYRDREEAKGTPY